jgi:hypothetical protein
MHYTVDAIVNQDGTVQLLEGLTLNGPRRALVTILDEPGEGISETALLSELALGHDWNRPEEDEAWSHLQSER